MNKSMTYDKLMLAMKSIKHQYKYKHNEKYRKMCDKLVFERNLAIFNNIMNKGDK